MYTLGKAFLGGIKVCVRSSAKCKIWKDSKSYSLIKSSFAYCSIFYFGGCISKTSSTWLDMNIIYMVLLLEIFIQKLKSEMSRDYHINFALTADIHMAQIIK